MVVGTEHPVYQKYVDKFGPSERVPDDASTVNLYRWKLSNEDWVGMWLDTTTGKSIVRYYRLKDDYPYNTHREDGPSGLFYTPEGKLGKVEFALDGYKFDSVIEYVKDDRVANPKEMLKEWMILL